MGFSFHAAGGVKRTEECWSQSRTINDGSPRPAAKTKEKPGGVTGGPADPHSSQTYFSERPHRVHRKAMKSGLVSLTSRPANIMRVPQSGHAGSSPVSKG
jgi:hypothetical protein